LQASHSTKEGSLVGYVKLGIALRKRNRAKQKLTLLTSIK